MRWRSEGVALLAALMLAACGDGGTDPGDGDGGGNRIAERFEELADSVDGEGWSPTAQALRHAAEIVRLAGGATPVTLTIDGESRAFEAVAEQIDFPNIVCSWPDSAVSSGDSLPGEPGPEPPGGEGGCEQVGTWSMRTLIAWEPERMAEVVRIVADLGNTEVQPGVPDVMTGLPTNDGAGGAGDPPPTVPDSAVGEFPGFLGEYLVDDKGVFFAVEGTQSNDLVGASGACTEDMATIDWARFECRAARFRFAFDMRAEAMRIDPLPDPSGGSPGSYELAMAATEIDGVRLEVAEWVQPELPPGPVDPPPVDTVGPPPPPPPPGPPPVDSTDG